MRKYVCDLCGNDFDIEDIFEVEGLDITIANPDMRDELMDDNENLDVCDKCLEAINSYIFKELMPSGGY